MKKISGKILDKLIIMMLVFYIIIFIAIILLTNNRWSSTSTIILLFVVCVLFGIIFIINFKMYRRSKENSRLKNLPYYFDYQKELSTYKIIGLEKEKNKCENKNNYKHGAVYYAKYSDWKIYILETFGNHNDDFFRYLNRMLRNAKNLADWIIAFIVPYAIFIVTAYATDDGIPGFSKTILLIIFTPILSIFVTIQILNAKEEIYFIEDIIEILYFSDDSNNNIPTKNKEKS